MDNCRKATGVGHGFLYAPTEPEHWIMGSGKARERFGGGNVNPSNSWRRWLPIGERQSRNGFEPMDCTVAGALNAWETLVRFFGFAGFPTDCSERFNAILAGITPEGGSPHASAESIRRSGVVLDTVLPFSDNIYDWAQFYSGITPEMLALAKQITDNFVLGHEYVFNGPSTDKPGKLKSALRRSTVCVSVHAWREDSDGIYYKNPDDQDQHWVQLVEYEEGKHWVIFDTYEPFLKKVRWDTDFQTAELYFLSRRDKSQEITILTKIRDLCVQVIGLLQKQVGLGV